MKLSRTITALAGLLAWAGTSLPAQTLEDASFFAQRRAAFERTGKAPSVPPSLSANPADPEYVFLGYMPVATPGEIRAHFARLATARSQPAGDAETQALSASLADQDHTVVFINPEGEKWGFKSRDLAGRLSVLRRSRGAAGDTGAAASHSGAGSAAPGELEVAPEDGVRSVLGSDNRVLRSTVNGYNMKASPWESLGVLVRNASKLTEVPPVLCSATKVGERILLTAAHCVITEGGGKGSLVRVDWWPGGDGLNKTLKNGDPSPNNYQNIVWYGVDDKYTFNGWDSRDFAVLVLADEKSSCALSWFGYRVDLSLAGSTMWNFGYPGQDQTCAASPRADKKCGGSLYGMSAKITRTEIPYLFSKHDTTKGHSGSPIYDYNDGNRQVVGVVQGGYTALENRSIKIRHLVFDFIDAVRAAHPSSFCKP